LYARCTSEETLTWPRAMVIHLAASDGDHEDG
jgi:hypothetical protein